MTGPEPESSEGPSVHSPIFCPHPLEATGSHQALELVLRGLVSTLGPGDRLGPSQVRIKASMAPRRRAQPQGGCGDRLHPWKHLSPEILLGVLLPMLPEGRME